MGSKECLRRQLVLARDYTEKMLADFKTPEQWTYQVHKNANHALWFAGHMAVIDNFVLSLVAPEQAQKLPELEEKFGMGSQPVSDPAAYPAPAEVLATMRERREKVLAAFDHLTEEQFADPTGMKAPFATKGSLFEMAVWHEGLHSGQVSVARRNIGAAPILG